MAASNWIDWRRGITAQPSTAGAITSSKYSAFDSAHWPCRIPRLFDVELATASMSLFKPINITRNLVHLKTAKLHPFLCIHITHSAWLRMLLHAIVKKYFVQLLLAENHPSGSDGYIIPSPLFADNPLMYVHELAF
jgi:hypothetical protein